MNNRLVVCVCKYPTPGKVKTRLGEKVGMEKAAQVQRKFLEEVIKNNYSKKSYGESCDFDFKFCLLPFEKAQDFSREFGVREEDIFASESTDLGEMMHSVFTYGFVSDYKEILLIGSDVPTITPEEISVGFKILESKDIVLGEALDGGYYLVGMKKENKKIFQDIVYSTNTVLAETLQKCRQDNLSFGILEGKMDIDTYDELLQEVQKDKTGFYKKIIQFINEK